MMNRGTRGPKTQSQGRVLAQNGSRARSQEASLAKKKHPPERLTQNRQSPLNSPIGQPTHKRKLRARLDALSKKRRGRLGESKARASPSAEEQNSVPSAVEVGQDEEPDQVVVEQQAEAEGEDDRLQPALLVET